MLGWYVLMCSLDAPEPAWSPAASSLHFFLRFLIKCGNLPSLPGSERQTSSWIANLAPAGAFLPFQSQSKREHNEGSDTPWWMCCIGWVRRHKYCLCLLGGWWEFYILAESIYCTSPWALLTNRATYAGAPAKWLAVYCSRKCNRNRQHSLTAIFQQLSKLATEWWQQGDGVWYEVWTGKWSAR